MPRTKKLILPHCIGDYESGDIVCDGDAESSVSSDKTPCGRRDHCSAIACYINETGANVSQLVRYESDENDDPYATPLIRRARFEEFCRDQIDRYKVEKGIPTQDPVGDPPSPRADGRRRNRLTKKALKAGARKRHKKAKVRRENLWELIRWFQYCLEKHLINHKFVKTYEAMSQGSLFINKNKSYVTVFHKNVVGISPSIARLIFKPRNMCIDIGIPVKFEVLRERLPKHIRVDRREYTSFISVASELNRERVAVVAEALAKMIEDGTINLGTAT